MEYDWRPVMQQVVCCFQRELGENLVGIYLHGSAAFGCVGEGSDLDLIAVVQNPPLPLQRQNLIRSLMELEAQAPRKGIEMSAVLLQHCVQFSYPTPYQLHYSPMHRAAYQQDMAGCCRRMQGVDYDLAAHFTVIRKVGIVLCGKPIEEVFGEVPWEAYLDSIDRDIIDAEQSVCCCPLDTTLNLCRVLAAARAGLVLSKEQGAQWALEQMPQYSALLSEALYCYGAGRSFCWDVGELKRFATAVLDQIHGEMLKVGLGTEYNEGKKMDR